MRLGTWDSFSIWNFYHQIHLLPGLRFRYLESLGAK